MSRTLSGNLWGRIGRKNYDCGGYDNELLIKMLFNFKQRR